ncbi:DUF2073 domain-containing protein [Nanoarchaeota archaeon]
MVTLQLMPYSEIEGLSSIGRIRKLLTEAKENKIILLQGRLKKEEEVELIKATMEEINKDFKGIELAVINPHQGKLEGFQKMKSTVINSILGDRQGLTLIGAAAVIKSIKKDPSKIQLFTKEAKKKRKR